MIPNAMPPFDFGLGETADALRDQVQRFAVGRGGADRRGDRQDRPLPARAVAQDGRARPARHHGRGGVWRLGPGLSRARRRRRGAEPRLGGRRPELRRALQPLRQPDPPQRQRRAEAALPAQADLRRACRQPGDERVGRRLRRRLDEAARRQEGRPLRAERHQDVDHQQPRRAGDRGLCQDRSRGRLARHHHLHRRDRPQGLQGGAEARQDGHARLLDRRAGVRGLRDPRGERAGRRSARASTC